MRPKPTGPRVPQARRPPAIIAGGEHRSLALRRHPLQTGRRRTRVSIQPDPGPDMGPHRHYVHPSLVLGRPVSGQPGAKGAGGVEAR